MRSVFQVGPLTLALTISTECEVVEARVVHHRILLEANKRVENAVVVGVANGGASIGAARCVVFTGAWLEAVAHRWCPTDANKAFGTCVCAGFEFARNRSDSAFLARTRVDGAGRCITRDIPRRIFCVVEGAKSLWIVGKRAVAVSTAVGRAIWFRTCVCGGTVVVTGDDVITAITAVAVVAGCVIATTDGRCHSDC